jgi:hypothetical protein
MLTKANLISAVAKMRSPPFSASGRRSFFVPVGIRNVFVEYRELVVVTGLGSPLFYLYMLVGGPYLLLVDYIVGMLTSLGGVVFVVSGQIRMH